MEAIGYFDKRQGLGPRGLSGVSRLRGPRLAEVPGGLALLDPPGRGGRQAVLDGAVAALRSLADKAADDVGGPGFQEAVAFASGVEELSRTLDYLQLAAAAGLDAARNNDPASPQGWTTVWAADAQPGSGADTGSGTVEAGSARGGEFRSTAEHLRSLLRISAADARRRLALARELLPGRSLSGQPVPARHGETAAALASGVIGSSAAGIITMAVAKVRPLCAPEKAAEMEHALARTAAENDQDFLARVARRWVEAIDQDGPEPSEESLRHHQGAFLRRPKHGLAHVEIFATAEQYEQLLTVMNTAANPRTRTPQGTEPQSTAPQSTVPACTEPSGGFFADSTSDSCADPSGGAPESTGPLDRRSRAQKLLDGLVGACRLALATGSLPATGGHRPQILATIDQRDLFPQASRQDRATGSFTFTGPVPAGTLRKIACDAAIIPVVLGGEGQDWHIQVRNGIPWFIPPPHTDPQRKPRRNHYFQI
ncbi:DUF222 domain-containing protein [Arthrobacter bambusae]|uniref:DUF222 domain-containing protein n=1 Tax=Arthrobacter bambusae TaxID=1338426 RepID=UPI002786BDBC|nr:DUF222 domain-containing protein [Arthrobacter bambusae]MDQ0213226.1 hypothetical protein [Arthrobacter bambusae]MDQ0237596.1 hypothetical protein [Arthrobacter bambusae]